MPVTPSSLIAANTQASPGELWTPIAYFPADWGSEVSLAEHWPVLISKARTVAEQRFGMSDKPLRSHTFTLQGHDLRESNGLRNALMRMTSARSLWPLHCDAVDASSWSWSTSLTVNGDFADRRFHVGAYAFIVISDSATASELFQIGTISSVSDSQVVLAASAPIVPAHLSGTVLSVIPAIECDISLSASQMHVTDGVSTVQVTVNETAGASALPPLATAGSSPSGFDTYNSLPVLSTLPNWLQGLEGGVQREGSQDEFGIGRATDLYGTRGQIPFKLNYLFESRSTGFDFLRFCSSRGGSAYAFWLPCPCSDFRLTGQDFSTGGTAYFQSLIGEELDWGWYPFVYFLKSDGTLVYREIDTVTRNGNVDEVTFVEGAPPDAVTDYVQVGVLMRCRHNTDTFVEQWRNDEVLEMSVEYIELLQEKSVETEIDDFCAGGDAWALDPEYDPCEELCGTDATGGCCVCLDAAIEVHCHEWEGQCPGIEEGPPPQAGNCAGCVLVNTTIYTLDPVDCVGGIASWSDGVRVVELDTATGQWSVDMVTDFALCTETDPEGICNCFQSGGGGGCPDTSEHSCSYFRHRVACTLQPGDCSYITLLEIFCPQCEYGDGSACS